MSLFLILNYLVIFVVVFVATLGLAHAIISSKKQVEIEREQQRKEREQRELREREKLEAIKRMQNIDEDNNDFVAAVTDLNELKSINDLQNDDEEDIDVNIYGLLNPSLHSPSTILQENLDWLEKANTEFIVKVERPEQDVEEYKITTFDLLISAIHISEHFIREYSPIHSKEGVDYLKVGILKEPVLFDDIDTLVSSLAQEFDLLRTTIENTIPYEYTVNLYEYEESLMVEEMVYVVQILQTYLEDHVELTSDDLITLYKGAETKNTTDAIVEELLSEDE